MKNEHAACNGNDNDNGIYIPHFLYAYSNAVYIISMNHEIAQRPGQHTGNSMPYSLRLICGFFNVPQGYEHRSVVFMYRPYPRRLESLTICRCHYKGNTFSSVIFKDPKCWSGRGLNPRPPAR